MPPFSCRVLKVVRQINIAVEVSSMRLMICKIDSANMLSQYILSICPLPFLLPQSNIVSRPDQKSWSSVQQDRSRLCKAHWAYDNRWDCLLLLGRCQMWRSKWRPAVDLLDYTTHTLWLHKSWDGKGRFAQKFTVLEWHSLNRPEGSHGNHADVQRLLCLSALVGKLP